MKYKLVLFKADQAPQMAMEYSRNHAKVLAGYGCDAVSTNKETWMDNPSVYAIVAFDSHGNMVSGVRLHLHNEDHALPVESALAEIDGRIVNVITGASRNNIVAEACALWASDGGGNGLGLIMTRAITAAAASLGVKTLFTFASPFTSKMCVTLGYSRVAELGRNGDFLYPTADYISTVHMIPDLSLKSTSLYFMI